MRTGPELIGSDGKLVISDGAGLPVGKNQGSTGMRVFASFLVAQLVKHEFGLVVEFYGKPVPAHQVFSQLVAGKFVVHPAGSPDRDHFSLQEYLTSCFHARERNIMRGVPGTTAFFADSFFTMQDPFFYRCQFQVESCSIFLGLQMVDIIF